MLSPYFGESGSSSSGGGEKKMRNKDSSVREEIMDEDCAYHLAYDADRGCEHYNSARMVGTAGFRFSRRADFVAVDHGRGERDF